MKHTFLIACFLFSRLFFAQIPGDKEISSALPPNTSEFSIKERLPLLPNAPLLTTNSENLEICEGKSAKLTASSNHPIYWYLTPPPLGKPVGSGTCYITPPLTAGYYTYYAVADNNGIKSDATSMEVVMVYPEPNVSILSSAKTSCPLEPITLTASGTTSYEWENGLVSGQLEIQPAYTRSYKVTGINTAGCRKTVEFTQVVVPCPTEPEGEIDLASKSELMWRKESPIEVYPNPNQGEFHVTIPATSGNMYVEVYNWFGKLVYRAQVNDTKTSIRLQDTEKGIYTLRVLESKKLILQQKVVVE